MLQQTLAARALRAIRRELTAASGAGDLAAITAVDPKVRAAGVRTAETARALHHALGGLTVPPEAAAVRACLREVAAVRRRALGGGAAESATALALCDRTRAWLRAFRAMRD